MYRQSKVGRNPSVGKLSLNGGAECHLLSIVLELLCTFVLALLLLAVSISVHASCLASSSWMIWGDVGTLLGEISKCVCCRKRFQ